MTLEKIIPYYNVWKKKCSNNVLILQLFMSTDYIFLQVEIKLIYEEK